ncbi:hypothetical protein HNP46_000273 [Pseudomonas nitritireducens]|uniref:Uncharacterized protein n=1 Tax=Pseudomonas nitroreducens TaxID=46680 RepID=A0A7W7KEQ0_PSENT|nr:hypothetical protein [Pseudomonas nitritireducens]MBB4861462.1 hypothetical protein [Pseudomonas nitritireducens]
MTVTRENVRVIDLSDTHELELYADTIHRRPVGSGETDFMEEGPFLVKAAEDDTLLISFQSMYFDPTDEDDNDADAAAEIVLNDIPCQEIFYDGENLHITNDLDKTLVVPKSHDFWHLAPFHFGYAYVETKKGQDRGQREFDQGE